MSVHFFIVIVGALLFSSCNAFFAQETYQPNLNVHPSDMRSTTEAKKLWEKAIQAKGGRERLFQVKSLAETSTAEYTTHKGKQNILKRTDFFVFPDKHWRWEDMRPDVFGLRIEMDNYESRTAYVVTPESRKEDALRPVSLDRWEKDISLLYTQIYYFMETKWIKPVPVSVYHEVIDGQQVDVIQTDVLGKRFDFALDKTTHLPIRFIVYGPLNGVEAPIVNTDLTDYVEINGLKLPQKATPKNGSTYTTKFEINPEYNKKVFEKPTTIEAGPEAWRVKNN